MVTVLGYAFLLIIVIVDPESNKTLSTVLDLTKEMVPVTIIVTDVTPLSEL